jgi:CRISPR/Cas system endoribonuclease Cas6 (RAMP superfamily)
MSGTKVAERKAMGILYSYIFFLLSFPLLELIKQENVMPMFPHTQEDERSFSFSTIITRSILPPEYISLQEYTMYIIENEFYLITSFFVLCQNVHVKYFIT